MRLQNVRRIIIEDFPKEQQSLIDGIALILNPFMESIVSLSENNINFDNLNQELITLKVSVDNTGKPTRDTKFSTTKLNNSSGCIVISAKNISNSNVFPTTAPFISFNSVGDKIFKVNNITGLQPQQEYEIKTIIIGK